MYMESDLFNAGVRPALNVGLSVSRVGSSAQTKAMRKVSGRMKLELAQYRELAAFAQFGTSELDKATRAQLERGQRITEILKQPLYKPVAMEKQVMILYAAINGLLDDIPITKMREFEAGLYAFIEASHPEVGSSIAREKDINPATAEALKGAIREFKQGFK
jgi:F-type H+/Na+-transporting ATPase subunit alpha